MADELHPQVQQLLERVGEMGLPPSHRLSVRSGREVIGGVVTPEDDVPVGEVLDLGIPGPAGEIPVRVYRPDAPRPHPVVVFYHGGGWVRGGVDTHDPLCRRLARTGDLLIVSVAYRRAPEHQFPAALADAYTAVEWVAENAGSMHGDPDRLAVAGDSAGGNLAAAVTQMARARAGPDVDGQILLYPITDHAFDTDSYDENGDSGFLTRERMVWFWEQYLPDALHGRNPYASPLRARSLADLPPALVLTCGFDPLRDEGRAYAERLDAAGVPTTLIDYERMTHAFLNFPELDRTGDAVSEVAEWASETL